MPGDKLCYLNLKQTPWNETYTWTVGTSQPSSQHLSPIEPCQAENNIFYWGQICKFAHLHRGGQEVSQAMQAVPGWKYFCGLLLVIRYISLHCVEENSLNTQPTNQQTNTDRWVKVMRYFKLEVEGFYTKRRVMKHFERFAQENVSKPRFSKCQEELFGKVIIGYQGAVQ